jgi:hypothetical protein
MLLVGFLLVFRNSISILVPNNFIDIDADRKPEMLETYLWDAAQNTFVATRNADPEGRWEVVK